MNFYVLALGCKVNSYEKDALREALLNRGDLEVDNPKDADIIIVNTCSVTATSDQKSRQHIRKMRRLSPNSILVVMGCYSEGHLSEVETLDADIIVGTSSRDKVLSYIDSFKETRERIIDVNYLSRKKSYEELGAFAFTSNTRGFLKVQDGCDKFCSYCLIPFIRGNSRSRTKEEALKEARALVEKGYQEIVLTGIEVGFYGLDLYGDAYGLGDLIEDILLDNPTLKRLRLSSIDVSEITPKIIECFEKYDRLMPHLHLSLQSGSDTVLERMKRHYSTKEYFEAVSRLRTIRPDIAITTDIIAGFPLETEEEWKETVEFAKKCEFAEIHVFPYSSRKGTAAANMKQVDFETKQRRARELIDISRSLRDKYEEKFFGKNMLVLFEDFDPKAGLAYGHTENYLLVKVPATSSMQDEMHEIVYEASSKAD
ncbi:MAG: tRNA (N(6)-L-threonylcarbamoyladenosine(37)-C(2))-methylthiotransferase MtaB [Bacilli bacterium]|nr:tRNA (N(6)-L-threonylcarbamoyladenosine(37)-C(2))-methylthiotransferase MtaB [Bacilli bacterium]